MHYKTTGGNMGFAISWIALKGKEPNETRKELGLSETGEHEEIPESEFSACKLPDEWYLIYINECESPIVSSEIIESLSKDCEVVACVIEEHVMYSRAQYWRNGNKIWQSVHDAQQGMFNLESEGQLPDDFENIKASSFSEQESEGGEEADVDFIFEIPLLLANNITGFKHDEYITDLEYTVLTPNKQSSSPWWKFW